MVWYRYVWLPTQTFSWIYLLMHDCEPYLCMNCYYHKVWIAIITLYELLLSQCMNPCYHNVWIVFITMYGLLLSQCMHYQKVMCKFSNRQCLLFPVSLWIKADLAQADVRQLYSCKHWSCIFEVWCFVFSSIPSIFFTILLQTYKQL